MSDRFDAPTFTDEEIEDLKDLYQAILTMESPEELNLFLTDLCSVNELHSFLHRWQIVRRIEQGKSYEEIIRELSPKEEPSEENPDRQGRKNGRAKGKSRATTKVSSTTISRVKACYINPDGGYRTALKRLAAKNKRKNEE